MGAAAIAFPQGAFGDKYLQMKDYLSSEGGYWLREDIWMIESEAFRRGGLRAGKYTNGTLADFSGYKKERMKIEAKYYPLYCMKNGYFSPFQVYNVMTTAVRLIGEALADKGACNSFREADGEADVVPEGAVSACILHKYQVLKKQMIQFFTDFYDERDEFEKDVWRASRIPGARQSAAEKRVHRSISFGEIPEHYRGMVKRFMSRLVIRRSWSYSAEMLMYIKYFFRVFYGNGYGNGFFRTLERKDMERYLGRVASDYADRNATFRSKAVSFIRQFIDYIQLAEYEGAPEKDVNRLIFDDDIPRREHAEDTMSKVKYIPMPVREQLDASVGELEPAEMRPVYILLRESGWRGTDVLNLRYDSCLDYMWNEKGKEYVPYLCGEITKTGIRVLKIPIR